MTRVEPWGCAINSAMVMTSVRSVGSSAEALRRMAWVSRGRAVESLPGTAEEQLLFSKGYAVAWAVLADKHLAMALASQAWDCSKPARVQEKRTQAREKRATDEDRQKLSKLTLAPSDLYLWNLCRIADVWQREQEGESLPSQASSYRPSGKEMLFDRYRAWLDQRPSHRVVLIRFVTWLLWQTMDRFSSWRALALGCFLYSYAPQEVATFTTGALDASNFGRIKQELLNGANQGLNQGLKQRFRTLATHVHSASPCPQCGGDIPHQAQDERITGRAASCAAEQDVENTLQVFAGWWELPRQPPQPHPVSSRQVGALFDDRRNTRTPVAWEALAKQRNHALACLECGGIPQLVEDAMAQQVNYPQDPKRQPRIPSFIEGYPQDDDPSSGEEAPSPPSLDPFSPPPLTADDWESIQSTLEAKRFQRAAHHGRVLRIVVDGEERLRFNLAQTPRGEFNITDHDRALEVFSRDESGDLLLAVLPVPELETLRRPREFDVTHEGGQRISLRLSQIPADDSEVSKGLVELTYVETHPVQAAVLLWERWRFWWERWQQAEIFRVPVSWVAPALLVLLLTGATWAVSEFTTLLSQFNTLVEQLHFDKPFTVHFSAVGQRSLQLDLRLQTDVVREVFVDWSDPLHPDPVGGTRIYPGDGMEVGQGKLLLTPITHEYGPVAREGFRTTVRVRIVPTALPKVRPESLSEAQLNPSRRIWVLPYGVVLDPPEARLSLVTPKNGAVVSPSTEVQIQAGALTADIHLLALDPTQPTVYRYLGKIPPPAPGQELSLTRIIETSQLGMAGPFRLVVLSTNQLEPAADQTVEWHAIPQTAPRDEIEVRHAGVILFPTPGTVVSGVGTVRTRLFLPNTYAAVAIVPTHEGSCWVQNDGRLVPPFVEVPFQVSYGGRDSYQVYVGMTYDAELFKMGDKLPGCPHVDAQGRPVYWIGPVEVAHE
jgi:hypothetical protein